MPSFGVILIAIVISLLAGSEKSVASDDNPWRMDDPDQGVPSQYDLQRKKDQERSFQAGGSKVSPEYEERNKLRRPGETVVPKSRSGSLGSGAANSNDPGRSWQAAPGKRARDEVFGYAGPQPGGTAKSRNVPGFGAFPSLDEGRARRRSPEDKKSLQGGFQFGGKFYGAFPSMDNRASDIERRQRRLREQNRRAGNRPQAVLPNVLPPLIPAPVPGWSYYNPYPGMVLPPAVPPFPGSTKGPAYQKPGPYGYVMPRFSW